MKAGAVMAVVALGSSPFVAAGLVEWLSEEDVRRVAGGEDLESVAQQIAEREFRVNVSIRLVEAERVAFVRDDWGGRIRAETDHEFLVALLRFSNHGRMDVGLSTHHFSIRDATNVTYDAELGTEHRFEAMRVRKGEEKVGRVAFEVPQGTEAAVLVWQGELGRAEWRVPTAAR